MDPRKLMERLKGAAALTEQDVGEFSHFKGKMMKISVHNYAVEDWGSLSLLESRGMAGLMRRDMLVINSCVKDIPVLVIQYMGLFGRRMLQVHVLDVMKDKTAAGRFASLGRMAEQSGTAVQETPVEWYTPHAAARQRHRHRQEQSAGAVGRGRGRQLSCRRRSGAPDRRRGGPVSAAAEAHEPTV